MKRALILVSLLALTSTAHADNRKAWKVTLAGSVAVGVAGAILEVHGRNQVDEAKTALCDGGAYPYPSCTKSMTNPTLTPAQVDDLNAKGDRGALMGRVGLATAGVATLVAAVALYEGFIKPSSHLVIAPDVGKDRAGAALQISW